MRFTQHPTWEDNIQQLFTEPYWIPADQRQGIANGWRGCMTGYGISLDQYESVCEWSVTIYEHLQSRSMPLTTDPLQFWPAAALEQLRVWINEGMRKTSGAPVHSGEVIPSPQPRPLALRVRRNILELTETELNEYRMRVEALGTGQVDPNVAWQKLAYIHTNWCLHYQEAFLLWHRAYLLYIEELLGCAIPYWNFMSPYATQDGHPEAGLIQPFKDETYLHPITKQTRPNPLRYAIAKDGKSKACELAKQDSQWRELCLDDVGNCQCKYVQRDPVLYTVGDDQRTKRQQKLAMLKKFQQQVVYALQWPTFSTPEGFPGYPWANIQSFDPPPPDSQYPHRCDFDGLYEQPHDNFHGWLGPDMADNAYTAFDPVFLSYHANIDRIFEEWKRTHPTATFTAGFPLRPFLGSTAQRVDFADERAYVYTTIGDMARDSRAIGFDYEPPKIPDVTSLAPDPWLAYLYVLFTEVKCTQDSYTIDVFLNLADPQPADITNKPEHYIGRMTRLGMGIADDKGRCIVKGVTRVLDASANAYALNLTPTSTVMLSLLVTDLTTGQLLTPEEYAHLPGFTPFWRWGVGVAATRPTTALSPNQHSLCH